MTKGEKAWILYEEYGLRIEVIAKRLGSKKRSISVLLSRKRRELGIPRIRSGGFPKKNKPKKPLIRYAGSPQ